MARRRKSKPAAPTVFLKNRTARSYSATFQTEGGEWRTIEMRWNGRERRMVGSHHQYLDAAPAEAAA